MSGYVYFISAIGVGKLKIGYSKNVANRMAQLQTGTPHELVLCGCIAGSMRDEESLHRHFLEKRSNNEWFTIDDELARKVSSIIKFKDILIGINTDIDDKDVCIAGYEIGRKFIVVDSKLHKDALNALDDKHGFFVDEQGNEMILEYGAPCGEVVSYVDEDGITVRCE